MKTTVLRGACTHNLKNVDLDLYPGEVVAITGVSGAGKSSLAFDTLYAEGQRRFVESFSPYARQFLERLERPPITSLEPVPAAIAVDRRAPIKSSRSTLATMADLEAYFSALFAREALPVCPKHGRSGVRRDAAGVAKDAISRHPGRRSILTYPAVAHDTEHYLGVRERLLADGYRRLFAKGAVRDIDTLPPSEAVSPDGHIDVVVDRVVLEAKDEKRLAASIESAWQSAGGTAHLRWDDGEETLRRGTVCPECAEELPEGRAGLFSYESALGACPHCRGFGRTLGIDYGKVIPDPRLSLKEGAIRAWNGKSAAWERRELERFCARHGIGFDRPWAELSHEQHEAIFVGDQGFKRGQFPGLRSWFQWLETRTYKMHVRVFLSRFRSYDLCTSCQGQRLTEAALLFRVGERNLAEWHRLEVSAARAELEKLVTRSGQGELARRELLTRLSYLEGVGLGYLSLDRQSRTLSGGEAQRVTLTAALGTSLHHALFVLDEPSVGLHPTDTRALNVLIHELASRGNVVLVVDHDPELVGSAHRVIELGPGAGSQGGSIVRDERRGHGARSHKGSLEANRGRAPRRGAAANGGSGSLVAKEPSARPFSEFLEVRGAAEHNLQDLDVDIPLGVVCGFAGPSGSGKSTLLVDIVYRGLARRFGVKDAETPGAFRELRGGATLRGVTLVDQSPLGRTSRGNAATYTKAWDVFRALFAAEPAAVTRGLTASHFSFNVAGGRCDACAGEGYETVEMQFLADVTLSCPVCQGRRFGEAVLAVEHRGLSVAALLERTIDDVLRDFADAPKVTRRLAPLGALGLGYLRLGQPLSTLSGGEAQRLKLARALSEHQKGALLILDEPSAGLHPTEVHRLVEALRTLVAAGGSVVLIDHDLELLRQVDWLIELGPGAGRDGGRIVGQGTPAEVARLATRTGGALRGESLALPLPLSTHDVKARGAVSVSRATEHNLKGVSVEVPHGALTVVTGPSGSGKSSLAFDVIFAEGQRRFLETLTPYARQFLPQMPRPHVESVAGVPPSVALEQRTARAGTDSTVATVTEVAHYLRLLFAKNGVPHCPDHDKPVARRSDEELYASARAEKGVLTLLAPVVRAKKGTHLDVFTGAFRAGIREALCDGQRVSTDAPPRLVRSREHTIDLIVAENVTGASLLREDFARALRFGEGYAKIRTAKREQLLSLVGSCPECGFSAPELDPRWFSFNTAQGRCEVCAGAGIIAEPAPRRRSRKRRSKKVEEPAVLPGVCPACLGERLAPIPRAVRLLGERYPEVVARSVARALHLTLDWRFEGKALAIGGPLKEELVRRLRFLSDVGLDYLGLDRAARTLSGGEMQRLRLAAQLGTGLTGALYVLDEPTIGLHPRDTERLLRNLRALVDLGSTVLVVEHDVDTIAAADHLIDLGPGGGTEGGQVVAAGPPESVLENPASPTGQALRAPSALRSPLPVPPTHPKLVLDGVSEHNLKNLRANIPTGRLVVVAGVSGSGKSTLVSRVLLPAVRTALGLATDEPGRFRSLQGVEHIKRAALVDQSPIGRTPRSVPATFLGIWDAMRRLFAETPDAKAAGFGPERFSFNTSKGGRCPACEGQGAISHEMSFLPDVVTPCASCEGARFEPRTLDIRYSGRSIADVLGLTIEEAASVFRHHREIAAPLVTLHDLGAGYITLGQSSPTLSGGEAQRLKLSRELTGSVRHEPTLYVLDEPTTGLHLRDVSKLIAVLSRLVERGDSVVVIEHHPVVIGSADWVLELGPEAGEAGGEVVFEGSPGLLGQAKTATGAVVRSVLGGGKPRRGKASDQGSLNLR